jgi:hypothetical protein
MTRSIGAWLFMVQLLLPQPPTPPRPPQPGPPYAQRITQHIADIRRKIEKTPAVSTTARRALEYSRFYLQRAETSLRAQHQFAADRTAAAADALLRIAEHQEHLRTNGGPKGPPPLPEVRRHLERVYFQLQQADYFLAESRDRKATPFPKWARDFYQVAAKAAESGDTVAADENAKCAEEVVRALENLAQAAAGSAGTSDNPPLPPGARF